MGESCQVPFPTAQQVNLPACSSHCPYMRDQPGSRPGMPLGPTLAKGVIKVGRAGVEFQISLLYIPAYKTTKCKNAPLKIGVVSYNEYKSHILIFTRRFFMLCRYEKRVNGCVKIRNVHAQSVFQFLRFVMH